MKIFLYSLIIVLCFVSVLYVGNQSMNKDTKKRNATNKSSFIECDFRLLDEEVIETQSWNLIRDGVAIEGSDYRRNLLVRIYECSKCGKKRACKYLDNQRNRHLNEPEKEDPMSLNYAEKLIAKARKEKE
jgi:hypothetical protein